MSYEIPFKVYCEQRCPYKDNRQLEPERWEHLEPCINCPAEGFAEYLRKSTEGKTIHIGYIKDLKI